MRPGPDRPLNDVQERLLIYLATSAAPGGMTAAASWGRPGWARTGTLFALERRGLIRVRLRPNSLSGTYEGQITRAGLDLLATMGD
jgi:hypothetical protein